MGKKQFYKKILFASHNDDEALFCAYTIMREKPLVIVCFDSYVQDWTNWEERRKESEQAVAILGAEVDFLGLSDKDDTKDDLREAMQYYKADKVWACTGSHKHHKWLGEVARELWPECTLCSTYEGDNFHVETDWEIQPTLREMELKEMALDCYKTQHEKNRSHFEKLKESEYYV